MQRLKYERIIFICTDNTCCSPMADSIFKTMPVSEAIESFSRGLVVLFPEPMNPKVEEVLKIHGISMSGHIAKQFHSHEAAEHTLILTMTENQKMNVTKDYFVTHNVYTIKEFVGEYGDCMDPYGGNLLAYEDCYSEIVRLVKKSAYRIQIEV